MQAPTEINTGIRIIRLAYNNKTELSEFENDLLDKYKQLHLDVLNNLNLVESFCQELSKLKTLFADVVARFQALQGLLLEMWSLDNTKVDGKEKAQMNTAEQTESLYNTQNKEMIACAFFLQDKYNLACDSMGKLVDNGINLGVFFESFRVLASELYQNCEKYEIDIVRFKADEHEFLSMMGAVTERREKAIADFNYFKENEYGVLVSNINDFINFVDKFKEKTPLTEAFFQALGFGPDVKNKKQYYIAATDVRMSKYANLLDTVSASGMGIELGIEYKDLVKNCTSPVVDIINVAQHSDKWIESIIFKIRLKIMNISSGEPDGFVQNMLGDRKMLLFLERLSKSPIVIFFLSNNEVSLMCLAADILLKPGTNIRKLCDKDLEGNNFTLDGFSSDDLNTIFQRFFDGCSAFYLYCDKTNINTRFYIEKAITEMKENFGLTKADEIFSYKDVMEHCEKIKTTPYPFRVNLN